VQHNLSDRLRTLHEAQDLVARWIAHWASFGVGYWCVRQRRRSGVVGYCGTKVVMLRGHEELKLMYRFSPEVWGRGIATEAAGAVVAWADAHQPDRRVIARIAAANLASQHVASKVGLLLDPAGPDDGEDGPDLIFSRPQGS
jgi:RimJ/RimL family protein N-acetyltransferase